MSAFAVLEYLARERRHKAMYALLDHLCCGIAHFQAVARREPPTNGDSYEVDGKLQDVINLLQEKEMEEVCALQNTKKVVIFTFESNAAIPFRDATPKNYIIPGVSEEVLQRNDIRYYLPAYWIDFSSVAQLTTMSDDYISILYHYMIPSAIRNELYRKHNVVTDDLLFNVTAVVRLARFFVRRYYYHYYEPVRFSMRYPQENIAFYRHAMRYHLSNVVKATRPSKGTLYE